MAPNEDQKFTVDVNLDSPPLRKLLKVIASGVGAVAGSWLTRRDAGAEADAMRLLAQGETDARAILEGTKQLDITGKLTDISNAANTALQGATNIDSEVQARVTFQERKRQANLRAISEIAHKHLSDKVSDEEVDEDWIARFFSAAQDVTNEEMQLIWGKLLAGEVAEPGSYSLRALEIVRNLTREEASTIENILRYMIADAIPFLDQNFWDDREIIFDKFLLAEELGVLQISTGINKLVKWVGSNNKSKYAASIKYGNILLMVSGDDPKAKLKIPVHVVTKVGVQIRNLVSDYHDHQYIYEISKICEAQGFDFHIADFVYSKDGSYHYANKRPALPEEGSDREGGGEGPQNSTT